MNEHDILKELENLNDDSEPGFLKELTQQAPEELHMRLMSSLRQEIALTPDDKVIELKRRNRFDYRRYASLTAAAALLVFAFVGGANQLLKSKVTPESISPKANIQITGNVADAKTNTPIVADKESTKKPTIIVSTTTADNAIKHQKAAVSDHKNNPHSKVADKSNTKTTEQKLVAEKTKPSTITSSTQLAKPKLFAQVTPHRTVNLRKGLPKNVPNDSTGDDITISQVQKTIPDNSKAVDNAESSITPKTSADNSVIKSTDNTNPVDNSNPTDDSKDTASVDPNNKTALDQNSDAAKAFMASMADITINYEISIPFSQTDILQFIKEKGVFISEEIYKLNKTDFATLNQMLDQNNIQKNLINEISDQFIVVKISTK